MLKILRIDRILFLVLGLLIGGGLLFLVVQMGAGDQIGIKTASSVVQQLTPTDFLTGPLIRSLGVNTYVEKDGVGLKVNTLEVYGDGIGITYTVIPPKSSTGMMTLVPEYFVISDSAGKSYSPREDLSSAAVGPLQTRGYLALSPTVSDGVKTLTVSVPHMVIVGATSDGKPKVVDGPWDIQVTLNK